MDDQKKLYRSKKDRILFGVCGGLGEYFGIDPIIFRGVFLLFVFGGGAGALVYIILAIIIPENPNPEHHQTPVNSEEAKQKINEFAQEVRQGAKNLAEEFKKSRPVESRKGLLGLIIILVGSALLLDKVFPQSWFRWDLLWPVLLILIGVAIISKKRN